MDTIKLRKPLLVNGKELGELPYDLEAVSVEQFIRAEALAKTKTGGDFAVSVVENDYSFHLELGFAAIMAADPSIDVADLDRISGRDLMEVMRVGRNFIGDSSESREDDPTGSGESSSGERPASSQSSTTRASTK